MASNLNNTSVDAVKRRPLPRSRHIKDVSTKFDGRRATGSLSKLSPEAQIAMKMTQEDIKENISLTTRNMKKEHRNIQEGNACNNKPEQQNVTDSSIVQDSKFSSTVPLRSSCSRLHRPTRSRKNTVSSLGASILTSTERSRSTLSHIDRNYSISENTDSCYNYSNSNIVKGGVITTCNLSNKDNNCEYINKPSPTKTQEHLQNCEENYITDSNENVNRNEIIHENKQITQPTSFVLALDQVLEQNFLSRLKGDITNTTRVDEPGKVRALDGGRLTNAQEVVVNVCHDDDRELIFHDDDEETLSNAKAMSEIRINLWLKYNEGFTPDDVTDDMYTSATVNESKQLNQTNEVALSSESRNLNQVPRERTLNKQCSGRSQTVPRSGSISKWHAIKTGPNNSNILTVKKPSNSNTLRDISSSRISSNKKFDDFNSRVVSSPKKDRKC